MIGDFQGTTITVGALLLIAGAIWGVVRTLDWLNAKFTANEDASKQLLKEKIEEAVLPIAIKQSASELRAEQLSEKLKDFEVSVVSNFVSNTAVQRLEGRMDEGFKGMRDEVSALRDMLIKKMAEPSPR